MMRLIPSLAACLVLAAGAPGVAQDQIPSHPDELSYPTLDFEPPQGSEWRHELSNGVPVWVVPSSEFPLVEISFTFKGGAYLVPREAAGLAGTLGTQMRRGGTQSIAPDDLEERLDFLAADVSTFVGDVTSGASLDCLKSNFDEAFGLFMDVVRNPGFDAAKLRLHKDQVLESFKQRNDNPMGVAMPTLRRLAYGEDHFSTWEATKASIEGIDRDALRALHGRIFHPGNLYVAVTGDVTAEEILAVLEAAMEGWAAGERNADPPQPQHVVEPKLFHARTSQEDLPQGTTLILGPGIQRDDPDAIPLRVMNDILGGSGFTSRVTNRVRSDEGLAYTAVTQLRPEVWYPGVFLGFFQSKNRTVALAAKLVFEEIRRIRDEPVSEEELRVAKDALIEAFPQSFASKSSMLGVFVDDALTGRDPDYWSSWRERVTAVDAAAVQRVAREHLDPAEMGMLVVGDWEAIEGGDLEGRASMAEFYDGQVEHLPLLDPLTREPIQETPPGP